MNHNYEHCDAILDMVLCMYWMHCDGLSGTNGQEKNLIRIEPLTVSIQDAEVLGHHNQAFRECRCVQGTNINRIEYNHDKLYRIGRRVGMDPRYKVIDRSACTRIRKLHLNKRGKRVGKRLKHHTHRLGLIPDGVNSAN